MHYINAYVFFYYLWTNDSDQAVTVNIDGYLIADGYVELQSDGGFWPGDRRAETWLTPVMAPWEWWHQPAPLPLVQEGQIQAALSMKVSSGGFAAGAGFDAKAVFRGFDLQYPGASMDSVVFENKEHDFPQRVGYRRLGADSVLAWIDGTSNGKAQRFEFPYRRVPCPSAQ